MRLYVVEFTVVGSGHPFPVDMLMHNQCWPASEGDVTTVLASLRRPSNDFRVRLRRTTYDPDRCIHRKEWVRRGWDVAEAVKAVLI